MKSKYTFILIITALIFYVGCENPLNKNPVIGIIKNLSGSVKYYPGGSDEFVTLRTADIDNRPLFSMDMIEIAKNSFLHLHFYEHGDAYLGNEQTETRLIIKKPSAKTKFQVLTELKKGVMDCFIEKKGSRFAVQTPVAVAGVLGTFFKVAVADNKTFVTMIEGENGTEIQNIQQSLMEPTILKKIQQIEINHGLIDPSTLSEKFRQPPGSPELEASADTPIMPHGKTKPSSGADTPIIISNFDSPMEFKYPIGLNQKGELEFKTYIEYGVGHRTKTYSR